MSAWPAVALAEDEAHTCFEHAQVAMLVYDAPELRRFCVNEKLDNAASFSFYYLLACHKYGLHDLLTKRRENTRSAQTGISCMPEEFSAWRSYCHAWSAHWLYHTYSQDAIAIMERIK